MPACVSGRLQFSAYQDMDRVCICAAHCMGTELSSSRINPFGLQCVRHRQGEFKKLRRLVGKHYNQHIRDCDTYAN